MARSSTFIVPACAGTCRCSCVMLSMFGWAAGIVPAIIDGTISVNRVMHNTMWVPGHFHFYLLLGVVPMLLGIHVST